MGLHKCVESVPSLQPRRPHHNGHRPARTLRLAEFDAPISPKRYPRSPPLTLLGPQRGGFLNALNPNNVKDGTPGQRALPATGWAGGFVLHSSCFVLCSVTVTGFRRRLRLRRDTRARTRRAGVFHVPCFLLPGGRAGGSVFDLACEFGEDPLHLGNHLGQGHHPFLTVPPQ